MLADPRVAVADPESGEWPGQRGDQGARMASTVAADPTPPPPCPVAPRPPAQITTRTTGTAHAAGRDRVVRTGEQRQSRVPGGSHSPGPQFVPAPLITSMDPSRGPVC